MSNSKMVSSVLMIMKHKRFVIAVTVICIVAVVVGGLFAFPNGTASTTVILHNSPAVAAISQAEDARLVDIGGGADHFNFSSPNAKEVMNYVESIKASKILTARQNPYLAEDLFPESDLLGYFSGFGFTAFLETKGIAMGEIGVVRNNESVTLTAISKEKESKELLRDATAYMAEYIEMEYSSRIQVIADSFKTWKQQASDRISTLIREYEVLESRLLKANSLSKVADYEECRALLNEYAEAVVDYEICGAVVRQSEALLNMKLAPDLQVMSNEAGQNSTIMIVTVLAVVALLFGVTVSIILVYLKEFFVQVKKARKESEKEVH